MRKLLVLIFLLSLTDANAVLITYTESFTRLVNNHRISKGLRPLSFETTLNSIARTHSYNMAYKKVSFGHAGFSARCDAGFDYLGSGSRCAENVAYGQSTPRTVFDAWLRSSGHRANIENPSYTHTGLGYKKSATGVFYWTQLFFKK